MTLSQIIAKDSFYDLRIPIEGYLEVWLKIENGRVVNIRPTQDIREADKKKKEGKPVSWEDVNKAQKEEIEAVVEKLKK